MVRHKLPTGTLISLRLPKHQVMELKIKAIREGRHPAEIVSDCLEAMNIGKGYDTKSINRQARTNAEQFPNSTPQVSSQQPAPHAPPNYTGSEALLFRAFMAATEPDGMTAALAARLLKKDGTPGVTTSAVSQWKTDGKLPKRRWDEVVEFISETMPEALVAEEY